MSLPLYLDRLAILFNETSQFLILRLFIVLQLLNLINEALNPLEFRECNLVSQKFSLFLCNTFKIYVACPGYLLGNDEEHEGVGEGLEFISAAIVFSI